MHQNNFDPVTSYSEMKQCTVIMKPHTMIVEQHTIIQQQHIVIVQQYTVIKKKTIRDLATAHTNHETTY